MKDHIVLFHLLAISRIGKYVETEGMLMFARDEGRKKCGERLY